MRKAILFSMLGILLATVSHRDYAQIPNSGFEVWSSGAPDSWLVNNLSGFYTTVAQSADAHGGSSAAAGTVVAYNTNAIPPSLVSGSNYVNGFPVNARHAGLHMWYKFAPVSGDHLSTTVFMQKAGNVIATGLSSLTVAQNSYTENIVDITYYGPDVPDTCLIAITITGSAGLGHVGSTFLVDDLTFGASTGVETSGNIVPESYQLSQNFPNPFNPTTTIGYTVGGTRNQASGVSNVRLSVFDILGREVAVLVNEEKAPGIYEVEFSAKGGSASGGDATGLSSGVYFYRLTAGQYVESRKMVLMK